MRPRMLLGAILAVCGLLVAGGVLIAGMLHYALPVNYVVMAACAVVLFAVGLVIVLTEVFEKWLTHSQAALVDGLQAG